MNIRLLIGFIFMGIGFVFMPISVYKSMYGLESVLGKVISTQSGLPEDPSVFYVNYEYSVGEKSYLGQEVVPLFHLGSFPNGKTIKVNYHASSPSSATLYEFGEPLPLFLIFGIIGLLGIFLFFVPRVS